MKNKKTISLIIAVSFVLLIGFYTICNIHLIPGMMADLFSRPFSIREFSEGMSEVMGSDDLYHKNDLINLSGLYARLTFRRVSNGVLRMDNGILAESWPFLYFSREDKEWLTSSLVDFDKVVSGYGGHFVFLQLPPKYEMHDAFLPKGLYSTFPSAIEGLVKEYRKAGIDVVDTLPLLIEGPENFEANFYRTDHHWKPSAAFKAFQMLIDRLREIYPEVNYGDLITDSENWTDHLYPDYFLGSYGKRVGEWFTGVDELELITPDFETELSLYVPEKEEFSRGDFNDALMKEDRLGTGENKFADYPYFTYIGDNYALIQTRNMKAVSDQKVLMIEDSFDIPLVSFLSTVFRSVDSIDPRFFKDLSLNEYVSRTRPDIVLMGISGIVYGNENYFVFSNGKDEFLTDEKTLLKEESPAVAVDGETVFFDRFENDRHYTLSVPAAETVSGPVEALSAALYDPESDSAVTETVFDIAYCNKYGDCEWTFKTPPQGSENLRLLLSARTGEDPAEMILRPDLLLYERAAGSAAN